MSHNSLQMKVVLGYYAISAIALCLSLFTLVELRLVERQVEAGSQISRLLNHVLEMRRFEKNWLLYRKIEDVSQILEHADLLQQGLNTPTVDALVGSRHVEQAQALLTAYTTLFMQEIQSSPDNKANEGVENRMRALGKSLLSNTEEISERERLFIRSSLEQHRTLLLIALVVVLIVITLLGSILSRIVVTPLKQLEESMQAIADGNLTSLHLPSSDREIRSLTEAFNRMLQELELRHTHLLRSKKLAAMGTLLSGVAHELNNPLSNIFTSCQILQEEMQEQENRLCQEMVEQIDLQVQRARNIVRSLLDCARDRPFRQEAIPLFALINEVIRFNKGNIPPPIAIEVQIPVKLQVLGDRQRLQQLFINLLNNAVQAINERGRIQLTVRHPPADWTAVTDDPLYTACRNLRERPWLEIRLQDSGIGIAPEHIDRIFDPFFTTKPVGKGSGLGLAVVFEIVEEHEGAIVVTSTPGQGTLFRLALPLADPTSLPHAELP
ncbi:MAG: HAMP domain-containing histidine kinase [Magnetococcales bacterium]|nr:HAMP domain-containing histidine kinase [Magnetococcales bacterium]